MSAKGRIENSLDEGHKLFGLFGELYDNGLDAGATRIRVFLTLVAGQPWLYFVDNGSGMTLEKLQDSTIWDRRSTAGGRHGRFGIGGRKAHVCLTMAKGVSKTLTMAGGSLFVCNVDWAACIAEDRYAPVAAAATAADDIALWRRLQQGPSGTIVALQLTPARNVEIRQALADTGVNGLEPWLARVYHEDLQENLDICFVVDGVPRTALADGDPLQWRAMQEADEGERQTTTPLAVLVNSGTQETRALLNDNRGDYYYDFTDPKKPKRKSHTQTDAWQEVGELQLCSAHRPAWEKESSELQGIFLKRRAGTRAKIVDRIPPPKAELRGQDVRRYKATARHTLTHSASVVMDRLMGIQTDKSRVDPEEIDAAIMETVRLLCKEFAGKMNKMDLDRAAAEKAERERAGSDDDLVEPVVPNVVISGDAAAITITDTNDASAAVYKLNALYHMVATLQARKSAIADDAKFMKHVAALVEVDRKAGLA